MLVRVAVVLAALSLTCLLAVMQAAAAPAPGRDRLVLLSGPVPPDTAITFGPEGWTNLTRPVYGYQSDNPEASFECRLDSEPFDFCGPATYEVLEGHRGAELSEGTHTIEVRAMAPDGEADPTPARAVIMVDTHPPTATILSGPTGVTHRQRPTFKLEVAGEDSFTCHILGRHVKINVPSCDGPTSFTPPRPLAEGAYEMVLVASDRAGNATEDRREFSVRTKPGPPPPPPNPYRDSSLYSGRGEGVRAVFRLKGHKLIEARISLNLVCTGGRRRHHYLATREPASPRWPITVNRHGKFSHQVNVLTVAEDETEMLAGKVTPQAITGTIAMSWTQPARVGNETCRTGRFRPGRVATLSFRAKRRHIGP
jgi:hypothetical protein